MNLKFLVGVSILLLATWSFHSPAPRESGIEGQVLIGSTCPVAQPGQECPDQPYQATITVNSPNGGAIVQFQTDGGGHFRIPLAPGEYILHPESPNGISFAADQTIIVGAGQYVQIVLKYDNGIR
jgi:hypothetical protein